MNKKDLIEAVADKLNLGKEDATSVVNSFVSSISTASSSGEDVSISGFGSFQIKTTKERLGRNPSTNESINIPQKSRVSFKAFKQLKDSLNQSS